MDKKKLVLWTLIDVICLAVFYTLFFARNGFKDHPSVIVSAVFVLVAFVFSIATHFFMKNLTDKTIMGSPYFVISSGYFKLECGFAVFVWFLETGKVEPVLGFQVILLALYAVMVLLKLIFTGRKEESTEVTETEGK